MKGIRGGKLKLKGADRARNLAVGKRTPAEGGRPFKRELVEPSGPRWEDATEVSELVGPLILVAGPVDDQHEHGRLLVCLDDGLLAFKDPVEAPAGMDSRGQICPADAMQVVLGQVLVPGKVSLKAANRKYLSAHPSGRVNASRDAVGPTEEWRPKRTAAGFVFQDVFDRYLSADSRDGRVTCEMRDEPGPREILVVRRQIVPEAPSGGAARRTASAATQGTGQESYLNHQLVLCPTNSFLPSDPSATEQLLGSRELAEARKQGRLHEALLEKRIKSKHDPFC